MKISDKKKRIKHGAAYRTGKIGRRYRKIRGGSVLNYGCVFRYTVMERLTRRIGLILAKTIERLTPTPISSMEVKALPPDPKEMRDQGYSWPVQMTVKQKEKS